MRVCLAVVVPLLWFGASLPAAGALAPRPADDDPKAKAPEPVVTNHEVTIAGERIAYRATAGTLPLLDDTAASPKASVFYVSYERTGEGADSPDARARRPITFAFNGGPGSSSVWLHLGALGPRRVQMGSEGEMPVPPGGLIDNPDSWLDFTDLVFIDPVSTGFSRAADGQDPRQFHGLEEDTRAVADFIRLFLVRTGRWMSPKYLCGESYGTTRASALAPDLQNRLGVFLNGIVLVSPILNFQTTSFELGNDTPFPLYLPSYTATAFFHKALRPPLDRDLGVAIRESIAFAEGEYLAALMQGDALPAARRQAIASRLAELTGLSAEFIQRCNLRPTLNDFRKELLRAQSRTVGRLDSRFKGIDRADAGSNPEYDASYSAIQGPYTAALNAYVRGELKFESDLNYEILTGKVQPWNYPARNRYVNVAESLRSAMSVNPNLRVLACSGWYDFATPAHAMTWTISHLGLEPSLRGNIGHTFYESGHMMYIRDADRVQLRVDVKAFYLGSWSDKTVRRE
ncbi:MAG: S10 family peptidase [Phycisphaerales bacterium]